MDTSRASRVDGVMTMATADPPFLTHGIAADDCDDADAAGADADADSDADCACEDDADAGDAAGVCGARS